MRKKTRKRVIVGMSSGVDSSVAAALLKKQGYDVVGVFMHFWKEPLQNNLIENKCCSLEAQEDARRVCQILGIPLYTANVEKEFKKEVVDYFLFEYAAGRTPNPCVVCNEHIKFNVMLKKMLEMDGDFVASGHYAIKKQESRNKKQIYRLFVGKDMEKDQSYFLYNFNQKQLAKIFFPVGKYKKSEIRKLAKKFKLPVFDKDDSQGLCFTPEKYPEGFLRRNLKLKKGKTVDTSGKIVGVHDGLPLYTIGQRRGINIGGSGPYYVVDKDFKKNILIVTNDQKNPALFRKVMEVEKVSWIGEKPKLPIHPHTNKRAKSSCIKKHEDIGVGVKIQVRIRYRHPAVSAIIKPKAGVVSESLRRSDSDTTRSVIVEFAEPQRAITPGQSAVFYTKKGELLGGGRIK